MGPATRRLLELTGAASSVEEAISLIVANVLQDLPVPPTELEALKEPLAIADFCAEDVPFSGELRRSGKRLTIVYSIHLSEERRRFTIAHEIGHVLLERADHRFARSGAEIERLCDMLAAEILMPREVFLTRTGSTLSIPRLFELKRTFQSSLFAVACRCFELKRVSVFEIEKDNVRWGCGLVKKGALRSMEGGLRLNVEAALQQRQGRLAVYFRDQGDTHKGELEWTKLSAERTLFLLRRNRDQMGVAQEG